MHKIRVGVIRGGPSNEYDVSLQTGATVLNELSKEKYIAQDILIDRNGTWFINGLPVKIYDALNHMDVAFNALHGHYGEDGKIQHILETHGIPFTGSGSFASAVGMNKLLSKEVYIREKIKTPRHKIIESKDKLNNDLIVIISRVFSLPIIVKPVSGGSSLGVSLVKNFHLLGPAIGEAFKHCDSVMIEEYISGVEATVGVIDNFRNNPLYALSPVEIRPRKDFFDYESKYNDNESGAEEIVPGNFSFEEKAELEKLAIGAHSALGLKHYSRTDFIVSSRRGIFVLETNTLPGLTPNSLFPKALKAVGAPIHHFLDHIIELAIARK